MSRGSKCDCPGSCVQSILRFPKSDVAVEFTSFRKKLEEQTYKSNDTEIIQLIHSPYLFQRTTVRMLLGIIKSSNGVSVEHAIGNLQVILPTVWNNLKKTERWNVGQAYAEAVNSGEKTPMIGIQKALLSVHGFDYVPESLRSNTYTAIAKSILSAHNGIDNFYNEPGPMANLVKLGTKIPMPAFPYSMTATLSVYLVPERKPLFLRNFQFFEL